MCESSEAWRDAGEQLAIQQEAEEEAEAAQEQLRIMGMGGSANEGSAARVAGAAVTGVGTGLGGVGEELDLLPLTPELVDMAQQLGLRVKSDAGLLSIAAAALAAPLPPGWTATKVEGSGITEAMARADGRLGGEGESESEGGNNNGESGPSAAGVVGQMVMYHHEASGVPQWEHGPSGAGDGH